MIFDLAALIARHALQIRGVYHIGAHHGQELGAYRAAGIRRVVLFEPLPRALTVLRERAGDDPFVVVVPHALGLTNEVVSMYVESANGGMSSSVLKPKLHLAQYPRIVFDERVEVEQVRLDDWIRSAGIDPGGFNMMTIDVQGYEREVLRGAPVTLGGIDVIVSEVNRVELYEGCALVGDLDALLAEHGFDRVETAWRGQTWGDALYRKS